MEEFFSLSQLAEFRMLARTILIKTYFEPAEQVALASFSKHLDRGFRKHGRLVRERESSYQQAERSVFD